MKKVILLFLTVSCAQAEVEGKYYRKNWKHWTDQNQNCLNTRAEILKLRSLVPVLMNKKGCKVITGKWNDYYFPEEHTVAKKIDIDHLIPLMNAHRTGGQIWNKKQKEVFANDPENLVITNREYNRRKGAKGIDAWLPLHKDYACKYVKDWIKIKQKYSLIITDPEKNAIQNLDQQGCQVTQLK